MNHGSLALSWFKNAGIFPTFLFRIFATTKAVNVPCKFSHALIE